MGRPLLLLVLAAVAATVALSTKGSNNIPDANGNHKDDGSEDSRRSHRTFQQEGVALSEPPFFDLTVPTNLTGLVGKTAYLNCRVKNLGNRTVSWVRHRDIHLLTVGRYTYTSDQRFEAVHSPHTEDWTLRIRYPQRKDSGLYECQISTTPPMGHSMYLTVVEPETDIIGGPNLYIHEGSTINLTCVVKFAPEPPSSVIWSHNHGVINFDSPRGGISLVTEKGPVTSSRLLIQKAGPSDDGDYTCDPASANPATVRVHILNGNAPCSGLTPCLLPPTSEPEPTPVVENASAAPVVSTLPPCTTAPGARCCPGC
ncbi:zwei Ig domain protein zig-8-like isoform X3 [Frankliniella occidentalis]|uniref:Zwei Ig domain protein zig-8-like isoform X3 n=1 Tax=Frankliniella occidentalis TaxID=133901 RepID=A0A6J1S9G0_FRAOC|nr:zwei Ig domain protein zig-8-like isoform X3 [Frankliniella occidentalis]